jgi:chromosome segregation ATPase
MNALEKFLSLIGLSSERFEKMSEAEQANLTQISETHAGLEQERDTAISELETASARITELEASIAAKDTEFEGVRLSGVEALDTANARITELESQVTQLTDKLSKTPSAGITPIVTGSEPLPGQEKKKIRSWEVDLIK